MIVFEPCFQTMPAKRQRCHTDLEGLRGGHRQRAAASASMEDMAGHAPHSALATFLLRSYLMGSVSLPFVVRCAALAYCEPPGHPDLKTVSELGTTGAYANNYARDLFNRMATFSSEAALMSLRLPAKVFGTVRWVDMEIIYPHVIFAKLFESYPREFARRMFNNSPGYIKQFWDAQVEHPSYPNHPMLSHEFGRDRAIPIFTHGDDVGAVGVGKTWARAVDCLSWGSLVGGGGTSQEKHLLIWLVYNNVVGAFPDGPSTMQVLWRHVVWSLYWLFVGRWPTHDPEGVAYNHGVHYERGGQPLANGYYCTMWNSRFDLDWGQGNLHITDPSRGNQCMNCNATTGGVGHGRTAGVCQKIRGCRLRGQMPHMQSTMGMHATGC